MYSLLKKKQKKQGRNHVLIGGESWGDSKSITSSQLSVELFNRSSTMKWTWRAISSSKPTSSASSTAHTSNSRARLHNKRPHDNTWR